MKHGQSSVILQLNNKFIIYNEEMNTNDISSFSVWSASHAFELSWKIGYAMPFHMTNKAYLILTRK